MGLKKLRRVLTLDQDHSVWFDWCCCVFLDSSVTVWSQVPVPSLVTVAPVAFSTGVFLFFQKKQSPHTSCELTARVSLSHTRRKIESRSVIHLSETLRCLLIDWEWVFMLMRLSGGSTPLMWKPFVWSRLFLQLWGLWTLPFQGKTKLGSLNTPVRQNTGHRILNWSNWKKTTIFRLISLAF